MKLLLYIFLLSFLFTSCQKNEKRFFNESRELSEDFKQQWYSGKAEITSYTLEQARYGELRKGEAVLVFVTEDLSKDKLVKLDHPDSNENKIKVLKLNFVKKFMTGIYPYSMMTSAFTPVEEIKPTVKVSCSSQEWCGHTFSQLLLSGKNYDYTLHSYFESEGEKQQKIDTALLEDELWNQIRLNPSALPVGERQVIPSMMYQRLIHVEMMPQQAQLSIEQKDSTTQTYSIIYPQQQRILRIHFLSSFPYTIQGWEESYPDGFGTNKKMLTTTAVQKKTVWLDYWKHNANIDLKYRDTLQLRQYE